VARLRFDSLQAMGKVIRRVGAALLLFAVIPATANAAPSIAVGDAHVTEGTGAGATNLDLPVTLSAASTDTVTVDYALAGGTATADVDFTATGGTVKLAPGETSAVIRVPVAQDDVDEPDETLTATLDAPANATLANATATGTIDNDDVPTITANALSAPEKNTGGTTLFAFVITLSNPSARDIGVTYRTVDVPTASVLDQATVGDDYSAVAPTRLTFAAGEVSKAAFVAIRPDTDPERNERFGLQLSDPLPGGTLAAGGLAIGEILNDDPRTVPGEVVAPPPNAPKPTPIPAPNPPPGPPTLAFNTLSFKKPKTLSVGVSCPATMTACRTTLSVATLPARKSKVKQLRKAVRFGSRVVVVPRGQSATVTFRLSASNAKLVSRAGSVRIRALAAVRDNAGTLTTAARDVTVHG
jgi:hypothetical protein